MTRRVTTRGLQSRARYMRTTGDYLRDSFSDQPQYIWWMGGDTGGGAVPIGPNGPWTSGYGPAMPVVTRATSLITGPLTAAPFRTLQLGFGGEPFPRPRWVTDPMLVREDTRFPAAGIYPSVLRLSRGVFWTEWIRAAIWWGLGGMIYIPDEQGAPTAGSLRNVSPYSLSTQRAADGSLRWVIGTEGDNVVAERDGTIQFEAGPRYRVCVLRNPHSVVDVDGMSTGVFAMSPGAFQLSGQIDTYTSGTFRTGVPAGFLKVSTPGLQQEQADELKRKWLEAHGGDRRSIAVLNATTDFQALSLSPVDSALGEVKRLNVADVAMAFGLDPMTLGAGLNNSATYTNLRDAWENHRDFGLAPWIAAVEDTLTALLPGSAGIKVDLDRFANPSLKERVETGQIAVDAELITRDEWREMEGLPPLPTASGDTAESRSLGAAETSQKVYLAVQAGVLSIPEARQMIADAGGNLDPNVIPGAELVPVSTEQRRGPSWRR